MRSTPGLNFINFFLVVNVEQDKVACMSLKTFSSKLMLVSDAWRLG
jgi:hypothetical protein